MKAPQVKLQDEGEARGLLLSAFALPRFESSFGRCPRSAEHCVQYKPFDHAFGNPPRTLYCIQFRTSEAESWELVKRKDRVLQYDTAADRDTQLAQLRERPHETPSDENRFDLLVTHLNHTSERASRWEPGDISDVMLSALASDLIEYLADRARGGHPLAQASVYDVARRAAVHVHDAMCRGDKPVVSRARKQAEVPGLVSRHPAQRKYLEELLKTIDQGADSGVPLPRAGGGKVASLRTTELGLSRELVDYMWSYQRQFGRFNLDDGTMKSMADDFELPPLAREIVDLPPLSPESSDRWFETGFKVIEEFYGFGGLRDLFPGENRNNLLRAAFSELSTSISHGIGSDPMA